MNQMKTFNLKQKDIVKKWYLIDATDLVLGRLATAVAVILKGKNKPTFTPYLDCGDNVVIINAEKVGFNGVQKDKVYYKHTGYPGGIKSITLEKQLQEHPDRVIRAAVKGMLSKNPLGRQQMRNLRIYAGVEHPHEAQVPEKIEIKA